MGVARFSVEMEMLEMLSRRHLWGQNSRMKRGQATYRALGVDGQPASMLRQMTDLVRIHKDEIRKRKKMKGGGATHTRGSSSDT